MGCCAKCDKSEVVENAKKWMQKVTESPDFGHGEFTAYAKAHGGLNSDGTINESWARALIGNDKVSGKVRRQANLFLQFKKAK